MLQSFSLQQNLLLLFLWTFFGRWAKKKYIDQADLFDLFSIFFFLLLLFGTVLDGKLVGLIRTKLTIRIERSNLFN
jgi:hypothetical protein